MLIQKLHTKYEYHLNYQLLEKVGAGADGEVFTIDKDKVIKLCVNYDWNNTFNFSEIEKVLRYLKSDVPGFAKVLEYKYVGSLKRKTHTGLQDLYLYYYVMEKLNKISDDESKVFHTILSHEDNNKLKDFSNDKLRDTLDGLSYGLDFSINKVLDFHTILQQSEIVHTDIHSRNIMKDIHGNFKLIDFDRTYLRKV